MAKSVRSPIVIVVRMVSRRFEFFSKIRAKFWFINWPFENWIRPTTTNYNIADILRWWVPKSVGYSSSSRDSSELDFFGRIGEVSSGKKRALRQLLNVARPPAREARLAGAGPRSPRAEKVALNVGRLPGNGD